MTKMTKAARSAAAKKAAKTRKANSQKRGTKRKKVAKKAKAAGTISEVTFKKRLEKEGNLVLNGKGIPDIISVKRKNWALYEIKPYMKRGGYGSKGKWYVAGDKSRLLRKSQKTEFKKLVEKGIDVFMVYYYRKRGGTKTNPKYKFKYDTIKLKRKHFKNKKGPDPKDFSTPENILHWMTIRVF